MFHTEVVEKM